MKFQARCTTKIVGVVPVCHSSWARLMGFCRCALVFALTVCAAGGLPFFWWCDIILASVRLALRTIFSAEQHWLLLRTNWAFDGGFDAEASWCDGLRIVQQYPTSMYPKMENDNNKPINLVLIS